MNESPELYGPPPPRRRLWSSLLVGLASGCWLTWLASSLALGWDEGYTFERLDALRAWLERFQAGSLTLQQMFSAATLHDVWRFSREEPDGHGPFYALLSLAGESLTSRWIAPPLSYRIGAIALFAFTQSVLFATLARRWGEPAALASVGLIASSPRLVPELCFALTDGPLVCLALLSVCGWISAIDRRSWARLLGFGIALGLAFSTKFTGWLIPAAYLAWVILFPSARSVAYLFAGLAVAIATTFAVNVGWWPDPIDGFRRFIQSNLTRAATRPIPILFGGTRYEFSLPWNNTLIWTGIATPLGVLLAGAVGALVVVVRPRTRPLSTLILLHWLLIMVARAMPQAPGHDGVRQLAVAFAFFALLAGAAIEFLWVNARNGVTQSLTWLLAITLLADSASAVLRYHPFELSYYNPAIGGLPGATHRGYESTYFWDSLTPGAIAFLNGHTPKDGWVVFGNHTPSFDFLTKWGSLEARHRPQVTRTTPPQWVVLQHRQGMLKPNEKQLIEHARPVYEVEKFGVPLLSIFRGEDWQRWLEPPPRSDREREAR